MPFLSFSLLITLTSTLSTAMNRNIFSGCPSHIPHFKYMAWLQVCMPSERCLTSRLPSQLTWHYCLVIWLCLVSVYSQVKFSLLSVIYLSIFRFVLIFTIIFCLSCHFLAQQSFLPFKFPSWGILYSTYFTWTWVVKSSSSFWERLYLNLSFE